MGTTAEHDHVAVEVCETCGTSHQYPESFPAELRGCPKCRTEQEALHARANELRHTEGLSYEDALARAQAEVPKGGDEDVTGDVERTP